MDNRIPPAPAAVVSDAVQIGSVTHRLMALPQRSKLALAGAAVALAVLVATGISAGREPEWRVLYASVGDKDGGAIITALGQLNVPHKFSEGGGAIMVPADKVHEARLRLASQGLPKGGTVGFELMENQKFGTTQFQERLNFQRGLEGELARSIMSLSAVQAARVHLALPAQTAFLRQEQKPSASVLLTLYGGRSLERGQVAGIVHLVASSVPELDPRAVSVVDQNGSLLSDTGEAVAGLDNAQLQYVRQTEQGLSQRIIAILEPIVGAGNVRAQVTADIDFTQTESTAELYAPNQGGAPAAVRSQHLSEAPGGPGSGGLGGGTPGALSNQPPATPTSPVNGAPQALTPPTPPVAGATGVKRDAQTNYEVDKTVKVVRNATGSLKRLSAAVLVNNVARAAPDGKAAAAQALSAQQMEQVNALVREAIGFSKDRGDSVQVVNAPFTAPVPVPGTELPFWRQPETLDMARSFAPWIGLPLLALIVILGFVRPAMRALRSPPPRRLVEATVADPLALDAPAIAEGGAPALPPAAQAARAQGRTQQLEAIRQIARQDPATVANVVRNWASQPT
ncbi:MULTISPECIES: flagellar basal-body MS-ring/collar protein FliF [Ramlibacter]|uniref:Flagellar M-ring protein n=1 Tax=Ramlibacter aquaticus TaxID=2780094 RepID=A0ABR9SA92_9BURK|nr:MULTISPECIES: flagellar basal-body MS-ring/collar protein FliF [Ramlibacter]MBE7939211.1 flagellar M-ring protein FliF [Ramlibacter aquaticus]